MFAVTAGDREGEGGVTTRYAARVGLLQHQDISAILLAIHVSYTDMFTNNNT